MISQESQVSQALWEAWFPGTVKPADCNYQQFVAARNVLWAEEDTEMDIEMVEHYAEMGDWLKINLPEESSETVRLIENAKAVILRRLGNAGL